MRLRTVLALAAVLAGAACGSPASTPPSEEDAAAHDHSAHTAPADPEGVVEVSNPADGLWADATGTPLRFDLERVFGVETEPAAAVLQGIAGAVVADDGSVYVYDNQAAELVAFAPDGTVLWRAGGSGEDPGQFSEVRGIAFDGEATIYVVNQGGRQIDAWGTDGTHRSVTSLADIGVSRVFMGGFLPPDRLALVDDVFEMAANEYIIVQIGEPFTVQARFRVDAEPMLHVPQGFIFQLSHSFDDDHVLVGNWERYALRVFDAGGLLHRRITRDVNYLRGPGFALQDSGTSGISLGGLSAPVVLSTGHWLVYASWPTNVDDPNAYAEIPSEQRPALEWASSVDLFDADGRFLTSVVTDGSPLPAIGRPWAAGPGSTLYTVSTAPFPQVRRYRVVIEPPADHEH